MYINLFAMYLCLEHLRGEMEMLRGEDVLSVKISTERTSPRNISTEHLNLYQEHLRRESIYTDVLSHSVDMFFQCSHSSFEWRVMTQRVRGFWVQNSHSTFCGVSWDVLDTTTSNDESWLKEFVGFDYWMYSYRVAKTRIMLEGSGLFSQKSH